MPEIGLDLINTEKKYIKNSLMCSCDAVLVPASAQLWEEKWFSSFPTCNFVYAHDLEDFTWPFLLSVSWSAMSIHSFGALQCFIFWQVKLSGQKWEKSVLFCQATAFCHRYVCFYWMSSCCYTRNVMFVLWIFHWACLILLVIVYATKHCKIGVAFKFFNAVLFFGKLLQQ